MSDDKLEKIRFKKTENNYNLKSLPNQVLEITNQEEFNKLLNDYPYRAIIIDFWATWCAPCKIYGPIFEKAQQEYAKDFIFLRINVDNNPNITQLYGIKSIPTTLILKEKQIIRKFSGVVDFEILKQILEKLKF
jgi:thioredoxin